MSWEIRRHNWSSLRAQGSALKLPEAIVALQAATSHDEAMAAYWRIDNTVVVQGAVYEAALAVVSCLLVGLPTCTDVARPEVLELLVQIGSGEAAEGEVATGNSGIVDACLKELVRGLPMFISILERSVDSGERGSCIDLLSLCCHVEPGLSDRVRWYFGVVASAEGAAEHIDLIRNCLEGIPQ